MTSESLVKESEGVSMTSDSKTVAVTPELVTKLPESEIVAYDNFGQFYSIEVGHYPAGEPYIKDTPTTCRALIVRPKSLDTLLAALFLLDTAWAHHWGSVDLIL